MVSFIIDSSIDGAVHIFGPNRSIFTRIFWTFLFILSIFGLVYYIKGSYTKWLIEPDIITKNSIRYPYEYPNPAITVCPQEYDPDSFRESEAEKNLNDENFMLNQEELEALESYKMRCSPYLQIHAGPLKSKKNFRIESVTGFKNSFR